MFQPGDDPFSNITPDPKAMADADSIKVWVKRHLGDDILSIDLTDKQIYTNFDAAISKFSAIVNEYYGKSNLTNFLGTATGSLNNVTGQLAVPTLGWHLLNAQQYAAESGVGGNVQTYYGNFSTAFGQQTYHLPTVLSGSWFDAYGEEPTGRIRIIQLYHEDPWDEFAAKGGLDYYGGYGYFGGLGVPAVSGMTNSQYQILPTFDTVLRRTMFAEGKRIRLSHYSYNILGNDLILFPPPYGEHAIWVRWRKASDPVVIGASGTVGGGVYGTPGLAPVIPGSVSSIANMPLGLIPYGKVNQYGKSWIWFYTLALCKKTLGYIRRKVKSGIPYPGGTTLTLDGDDFVSEGTAEQEKFETSLRDELDKLTYDKLAELEAKKAESLNKLLTYVPLGIYTK